MIGCLRQWSYHNMYVISQEGPDPHTAAQPTGAAYLNTLGALIQRALHSQLHRAPEGEAALELFGDALRDEHRVSVRVAHFLDVDRDGAFDLQIGRASCRERG